VSDARVLVSELVSYFERCKV